MTSASSALALLRSGGSTVRTDDLGRFVGSEVAVPVVDDRGTEVDAVAGLLVGLVETSPTRRRALLVRTSSGEVVPVVVLLASLDEAASDPRLSVPGASPDAPLSATVAGRLARVEIAGRSVR